jgi:hypothetical protein
MDTSRAARGETPPTRDDDRPRPPEHPVQPAGLTGGLGASPRPSVRWPDTRPLAGWRNLRPGRREP